MLQILPSNSLSTDDIIRSLCNVEGDVTGVMYMKYKGVALDVWRELNLTTIRYTKRVLLKVDKKTNSIVVPDDYLHWSSISYIDDCNMIRPMLLNQNILHDIVDVSLADDCGCENNCASSLCHKIKSYEAIQTDSQEEMPDGSTRTFTSISRKRLNADGSLVLERTFPVRVYDVDNVWYDVQLKTEVEHLCALEVNEQGCVLDNTDNRTKVIGCCNADTLDIDAGCNHDCHTQTPEGYNISELGNRIAFPSTFTHEAVLLRYYFNPDGATLLVPIIAKEAFISGIKNATVPFAKKPVLWQIQFWEAKHLNNKKKLLRLLNRYSIREWYSAITPKTKMV